VRDGGTVFYKARQLRVRLVAAASERVEITDTELRLHGRGLTPEPCRKSAAALAAGRSKSAASIALPERWLLICRLQVD